MREGLEFDHVRKGKSGTRKEGEVGGARHGYLSGLYSNGEGGRLRRKHEFREKSHHTKKRPKAETCALGRGAGQSAGANAKIYVYIRPNQKKHKKRRRFVGGGVARQNVACLSREST